ncbi:hypothetical protein LNP26_04620 [Klebsiella variicola subsp. variicola]|nr:hypothetical protein [Klebsiella variicola subsp. variicola]
MIISAHRLSALTEASEILVLQHGHIAQRGRHEALAVQPGWYRDMYRYQQLEAALDEVPQAARGGPGCVALPNSGRRLNACWPMVLPGVSRWPLRWG